MNARIDLTHVNPAVAGVGQISSTQQVLLRLLPIKQRMVSAAAVLEHVRKLVLRPAMSLPESSERSDRA